MSEWIENSFKVELQNNTLTSITKHTMSPKGEPDEYKRKNSSFN